jgi:hypothetical protein
MDTTPCSSLPGLWQNDAAALSGGPGRPQRRAAHGSAQESGMEITIGSPFFWFSLSIPARDGKPMGASTPGRLPDHDEQEEAPDSGG